MKKFWQILANLVLYGLLLYFAVEYSVLKPDPWHAFVVIFLLLVAVVMSAIPALHAKGVSPGEYPYED